jgi:hypothetical protein
LEYLRLCNKAPELQRSHNAIVAALMETSRFFYESGSYQKHLLGLPQREAIVELACKSNELVRNTFFSERNSLFPPLESYPQSYNIGVKAVVPLFMKFYENKDQMDMERLC